MAIIITDKMYVGFQKRGKDDEVLLGFATYIEDNAAFEKRKATVDSWAEGYRWQKKDPIEAKIMDNVPMDGFKIAREVRRCGWGGGNVVWRIEDPRGFELEISSANMASIMDCCVLDKGEIKTKCVWGWNKTGGSRVVLLPEGSEPYKEALEDTRRANSSVSMKEVAIGDVVELKNGTVGTYLGYFHYLEAAWTNAESREYHNQRIRTWKPSSRKHHFFQRSDDDVIYKIASPKVASIKAHIKTIMSPEQGCEQANKEIERGCKIDSTQWNSGIIFVSLTPIKLKDCSTKLNPLSYEKFKELQKLNVQYNDPVVNPISDVYAAYPGSSNIWELDWFRGDEVRLVCVDKQKLLDENIRADIMVKHTYDNHRGIFGCRSNWYKSDEKEISIEEFSKLELFQLKLVYNRKEYYTKL